MNNLDEIRKELDQTDRELVRLFEQRMNLCRQVALAKIEMNKPVLDRSREEQVLASRADMLNDPSLEGAVRTLFETLMALSREEQIRLIGEAEQHA